VPRDAAIPQVLSFLMPSNNADTVGAQNLTFESTAEQMMVTSNEREKLARLRRTSHQFKLQVDDS
jgi:hypothetical protein